MANGNEGKNQGQDKPSQEPAKTEPAATTQQPVSENKTRDYDPRQDPRQDTRRRPNIPRFIVECGDIKNSSFITLDCLKLRLRGQWNNGNYANGSYFPALGNLGSMPVIPGIRLAIDPGMKKLRIFDPLADNPELVKQIESVLSNPENVTIRPVDGEKVRPWPAADHDLDEDMLKSLLLELARKSRLPPDQRMFFSLPGFEVPTVEQCMELAGDELYDPWSNNPDKPKYVKDAKSWAEKMRRIREMEMV